SFVTQHHALRAISQGRFDDGEALSARAFLLAAETAEAVVSHRIQLFLVRREQGRLADVEGDLARAAAEYPGRWALRCVGAHLPALLGRRGEAAPALDALANDGFAMLPRDNEWLFALGLLPEVCEFLGDDHRAQQLYELLLPFAGRIACDVDDADTGSVERP